MKYVVDRIEGMTAVCEDENRQMVEIPLHALPFEAKEGATFEKSDDGYRVVDNTERHERIAKLMDDLWS